VEILFKLDHPHIVKFYKAYTDGTYTYLVLEKCNDEICSQNTISEELARKLSYKLLLALAYLHDKNICHLDIKPKNILATSSDLKLIDFGYACNTSKEIDFIPRGTAEFFAPEILERLVSNKSDMWSFGITLYNWLSGEVPYTGKEEEIFNKAMTRSLNLDLSM
jgi:serine/threonine protein kinase